MDVSLFDYALPPERIADRSVEPRHDARLLVVDRKAKSWNDRVVRDLPDLLKTGDLLIFNDSKVFKARLKGRTKKGKNVEVFLLRPDGNRWIALARPGGDLKLNDVVTFMGGSSATLKQKRGDGTYEFDFGISAEEVFALADTIGEVPVPPYVEPSLENMAGYQTVFAKHVGSVAAPTAGFHFTEELLKKLKERGVKKAFVTLHVGLGTFRPIKTDTLEAHEMHEEWAHVPEETTRLIAETKKAGGRVIVVGTTAMRALESGVTSGFTKLFITPGYSFKVADGLITNFHLPKSTLLVLVSSFTGDVKPRGGHVAALRGRELILDAYKHAIEKAYRFYSFGDAMLIV